MSNLLILDRGQYKEYRPDPRGSQEIVIHIRLNLRSALAFPGQIKITEIYINDKSQGTFASFEKLDIIRGFFIGITIIDLNMNY